MDRNLIIAVVLSAAVLLGWELTIGGQQRAAIEAQRAAREEAAQQAETAASGEDAPVSRNANGEVDDLGTISSDLVGVVGSDETSDLVEVEDALAAAPGRIKIDTPSLVGSINLSSGRIDDLSLKGYRETLDPESSLIRLLSPRSAAHGHYIEQGWVTEGARTQGATWRGDESAVLTPETPITMEIDLGNILISRTISVDDKFMFTVDDTLKNNGSAAKAVTPYGLVIQRNIPEDFRNFLILHEGPIAVVDNSLFERKYKKAIKSVVESEGDRGWVGITNKYWLAAAIPPQGETFNVDIRNRGSATEPVFRSSYSLAARTIAPGEEISLRTHLYGGAKDVDILQSYEATPEKGGLGVWDFDKAVDWGNFFFLTRPIFYTLNYFGDLTGNFGVAILILTLIIKALLFPLANKAYDSM
ncbi:MAG: membrane protein insertase YidC, partial [Pseudomonadota bacterium]